MFIWSLKNASDNAMNGETAQKSISALLFGDEIDNTLCWLLNVLVTLSADSLYPLFSPPTVPVEKSVGGVIVSPED